jgi:hypothetical protein
MTKHIVTAGAVIVNIGEEGGQGLAQHIYQGEYLPAGTRKSDLEHCLRLGLVAPEDEAVAELTVGHVVEGQAVDGLVAVPAGEPSDKWKLPELKQYAANRSVDLGTATTKADILVVLADAETAAAAEAERERQAELEKLNQANAEAQRLAEDQTQV